MMPSPFDDLEPLLNTEANNLIYLQLDLSLFLFCIRELCGVMKRVDKKIYEGVL